MWLLGCNWNGVDIVSKLGMKVIAGHSHCAIVVLCSLSVVAWSPQSGDSCDSGDHKTTMRVMVLAVAQSLASAAVLGTYKYSNLVPSAAATTTCAKYCWRLLLTSCCGKPKATDL